MHESCHYHRAIWEILVQRARSCVSTAGEAFPARRDYCLSGLLGRRPDEGFDVGRANAVHRLAELIGKPGHHSWGVGKTTSL